MAFDIQEAYYYKASAGKAFILSEVFDVSAGSTANIHLKNPDGSGKRLWAVDVTVSGDGPFTGTIHDSFDTKPSGGTSIEIENILLDAEGDTTDDGVATANKNVSSSSSTSHAVGVGGGGSGATSIGFSMSHPPIVMAESREVVLQVENTGSSTNTYGLTILYFESEM